MPKYYIWTIGCQMNKAESDRLAGYLEGQGYEQATAAHDADLILINSCVVRQSAENRVLNKLHTLKAVKKVRPEVKVALTGCIIGEDLTALKKSFPFIDYFFPAGEFPAWFEQTGVSERLPQHPQVTEYVPIMRGCNNFCSYCIVPYRRGREISRPGDEIVQEIRELVSRGVQEVTLLGQNVDSYGHDLPGRPDLAQLLRQIDPIEGLLRIRFLTNHPKDMRPDLIEAVASLDKVCEQINLPVQSGDDDILQAMRRGYTAAEYRSLIERIRARVPQIALSTDVIVGFPGETDEQFRHTRNLLTEIQFDMVHVAAYSPRSGTLAARIMEDSVPAVVKKVRLDEIEQMQAVIAGQINRKLQDTVVEVLVEGRKKGKWSGRTRSDKLVFFADPGNWTGKLVDIRIANTTPWSLTGGLADKAG